MKIKYECIYVDDNKCSFIIYIKDSIQTIA